MGGFLAMLPGLVGAGSSIFGTIQNANAQKWLQNALANLIGQFGAQNQYGLDRAQDNAGPLRDAALALLARGAGFTFGDENNPGGALGQYNDALLQAYNGLNPGQFQGTGITPGMQGSFDAMQGAAGGLDPIRAALAQVVSNGGRSQDSSYLRDRLVDILNGQGSSLGTLNDVGGELLGTRGQTGFTQGIQDRASEVLRALGQTAALQNAGGQAFNIIGQGGRTSGLDLLGAAGGGVLNGAPLGVAGLTPTGAVGEQVALRGLQAGGATPFTNFFQTRGAQLAGQDAVIPMALAVSLARDEAGRDMSKAAEKFREQALQRGGGPGAVVANGATNSALADFAEQGAEAEAQAVQDAIKNQQQLLLQQQQNGAQMGLQGGNLEAGRLGTMGGILGNLEDMATRRLGVGGGLVSDSEQQATQRLLSALGLIPTIENTEMNRVQTMGNLGLGASGQELQRLTQGGNLLNAFNQTRLEGGQNLASLLGMENQYNLGAAGAANNAAGTQGDIFGKILSGQLGAGGLGLNQTSGYYNTLGNLLGLRAGTANTGLNILGMGLNPLGQMTSDWTKYASGALGDMAGAYGGYQPASPWGNFFTNVGANLGGYLGGH